MGITVFHHNDNDGKAAAAVIYQACKKELNHNNFISVNYNNSIPTADLIEENNIVYIVDYSFTKTTVEDLVKISEKSDKVFWFDHHKSSLEVFDYIKENNICDVAIIDINRCGALITLDHFAKKGLIRKGIKYKMNKVIKFVDDYDRWIHNYPESMLFNIGSQLYDTNPTSEFWIQDPINAIEKGRIIKNYEDVKNTELAKNNAFIIKINGHECIVMNTPVSSSQEFGEYFDKYKFAIRFAFNGKNFTYSIYSQLEDIDCAKIAQRFNPRGGGHKGAAGFTSDKIVFSDQCVFVI